MGQPMIGRRSLLMSAAGLALCPRRAFAGDSLSVRAASSLDSLGEGALWSDRRNSLFWVDMLGLRLSELRADGTVAHWAMPEMPCWIIERRRARDGFVLGLHRSIATLTLDPFRITPVMRIEPELPRNRLNDAKADRWGRIWAGTTREGGGGDGSLYRIGADFRSERIDTGYQVTNGPTFSPDGHILYHADSPRGLVHAFDLDRHGVLSNKREFVRFPPALGLPDGMATDRRGGVWIAHFGGGRVSRFTPDGRLDRSIAIPATRVADCCFGGPGHATLYVTTCSRDFEHEPGAGRLYRIDTGERGLPAYRFAG